jgi:hypothetical protein
MRNYKSFRAHMHFDILLQKPEEGKLALRSSIERVMTGSAACQSTNDRQTDMCCKEVALGCRRGPADLHGTEDGREEKHCGQLHYSLPQRVFGTRWAEPAVNELKPNVRAVT